MKVFIIFFILISINTLLLGQQISGTVFEMNGETPVEYVNIGIVGKNIGTVSDQNGKYTLQVNPEHYDEILCFSSIGYHSYSVKVSDFINLNNGNVSLTKREYALTEVVIRPKKVKEKTLGITSKGIAATCIQDSIKGWEVGLLMSNRNKVFLKELNINVSSCSFDTVFYRINIYKPQKKNQFENILTIPVYISLLKEQVKDKITIDLRHLNLVVEGDFLVTFEIVKDLGRGSLCFYSSLLHKVYGRQTSQGRWITYPIGGPSISVLVDVESK